MKKLLLLLLPLLFSCTVLKEGFSYRQVFRRVKTSETEFFSVKKLFYGESKRQYVSIYYPREITQREVIWYTHGGGWRRGNPETYEFTADFFVKRGYITVMPSYTLVPDASYSQIIKDIFLAFKAAEEELLHEGFTEYILTGASAGAHLSGHLAFNKKLQNEHNVFTDRFKGFISLAGVLDFNNCRNVRIRRMINNLLDREPLYEEANLYSHLSPENSIEIFILHSEKDGTVEAANAESFYEKALKMGYTAEIHLTSDTSHDESYVFPFLDETEETEIIQLWLTKLSDSSALDISH